MKISSNSKSTILAGTFFAIITIVSISVANAQTNNENPILATSGPNVLEKGGSDDPMVLYKNFRGAEPDPDALLRARGLK